MATRVDPLEAGAQAFNFVRRGLADLGRFVRRKPLGGIQLKNSRLINIATSPVQKIGMARKPMLKMRRR